MNELQLAASLGLDADTVLRPSTQFRKVDNGDFPTEWANLPIDHDNQTVGTFGNRYWVSTEYYNPGGPVFVYDVGESAAYDTAQTILAGDSRFFVSFLQEFGAIGIVWEHRYYGQSLPPMDNMARPEWLQYLSNRQALADIPYFATNFTRDELPGQDLTPKATPWVMIGGSYSGMRAAFSRNEYPDTIFAAFASSSPVQAQVDMSVYMEQIYRGMVANGYQNCATDLHAAITWIDSQLAQNGTAGDKVKRLFLGDGAEKNSNGDFTAAVGYVYGTFQAYGMAGGDMGLGALCDWIEQSPRMINRRQVGNQTLSAKNQTVIPEVAPPSGLAPYITAKAVAERFAAWPQFAPLVNSYSGQNCKGTDATRPMSCELGLPLEDPDAISWTWQYCSQWGFFQGDNVGPHGLLSIFQTVGYNQEFCYRQFPDALDAGLLPSSPDVHGINQETGGWNIRPSNTYWSGGEFDPWRTLSPLSTETFVPVEVNFRQDVPQCNQQTTVHDIFGYVMPNAMHCFDFNMKFPAGATSRGYFTEALKKWFPCFEKKIAKRWSA